MSRRPRILQVGPIPPPIEGGIAAYIDGLMRSTLAEEFELIPFDVSVPVWAKQMRPLRTWASAQFVSRFVRTLRDTKPDIVHIHSSAYLSFWEKTTLGRVAERQGIPWVLHLHDGFFESCRGNLRNPLTALARNRMQAAAALITVCDAWRSWLHQWASVPRLHYIPNAIHVADFPAGCVEASTPRLLFVGDLTPAKGIDDLAEALSRLRSAGLEFEFDVVGGAGGVHRMQALQHKFAKLGLETCSHFHGPLYNTAKNPILAQASIFVLPSHTESFCLANLEAMACGLPVISTRTGAIPEVVRERCEGLLVEPRDVPALQRALASLILNPEQRIAMGAAAHSRARQFDWQIVGTKLAALYDSILRKSATGRPQQATADLALRVPL